MRSAIVVLLLGLSFGCHEAAPEDAVHARAKQAAAAQRTLDGGASAEPEASPIVAVDVRAVDRSTGANSWAGTAHFITADQIVVTLNQHTRRKRKDGVAHVVVIGDNVRFLDESGTCIKGALADDDALGLMFPGVGPQHLLPPSIDVIPDINDFRSFDDAQAPYRTLARPLSDGQSDLAYVMALTVAGSDIVTSAYIVPDYTRPQPWMVSYLDQRAADRTAMESLLRTAGLYDEVDWAASNTFWRDAGEKVVEHASSDAFVVGLAKWRAWVKSKNDELMVDALREAAVEADVEEEIGLPPRTTKTLEDVEIDPRAAAEHPLLAVDVVARTGADMPALWGGTVYFVNSELFVLEFDEETRNEYRPTAGFYVVRRGIVTVLAEDGKYHGVLPADSFGRGSLCVVPPTVTAIEEQGALRYMRSATQPDDRIAIVTAADNQPGLQSYIAHYTVGSKAVTAVSRSPSSALVAYTNHRVVDRRPVFELLTSSGVIDEAEEIEVQPFWLDLDLLAGNDE